MNTRVDVEHIFYSGKGNTHVEQSEQVTTE